VRMKNLFVCVLFAGFILYCCLASTLYGVVIQGTNNYQYDTVSTVIFDRESGRITNVTTNFVYDNAGFEFTDGISAFDQKRGTYYFASDGASAFIYRTNVGAKRTQPTIDIGAKAIADLHFDNTHSVLYVAYTTSFGPYLAALGSQLQPVALPTTYDLSYQTKSAVDDNTNTMFLATMIGGSYGIATINLANGQIVSEVAIDNKTCSHMMPGYLWFDSATGNLLGAGEVFTSDQSAVYGFLRITPSTGACRSIPINIPGDLVTDWSYDTTTGILWFAAGGIGSGFLSSYNPRTNTTGPIIPLNGNSVPTNLQISTSF